MHIVKYMHLEKPLIILNGGTNKYSVAVESKEIATCEVRMV